ncbi:AAA family ATPase [Ectothiorhodospiraceae bacterium WFHF3C12]|nr:AAA family ATPase [Ectothiorhodospiraceae bacterium WFHF3C12]
MPKPQALKADQVFRACDPDALGFDTTDDLEDLDRIIGQDRAIEALRFGTGMRSHGYNLFVLGPNGIGKFEVVKHYLQDRATQEPVPGDYCYVHNFQHPNEPKLLALPGGQGEQLRKDLEQLVSELRTAIPATFESDEYQQRARELHQELNRRQQQSIREIQKEADEHDIALIQTPGGFTFAPKKDGEVMDPEEFHSLPQEERERVEKIVEKLQEKLQAAIQQMPKVRKDIQERVRKLNEEMAEFAVGHAIGEFKERYSESPAVLEHLDAIRQDVVENVDALGNQSDQSANAMEQLMSRYRANVLVDNSTQQGAPVVYEDLPTYQHLLGRVEHHVHQGALTTDFRLIKPGALHRANGGYLILDVRKLLMQPLAWEGLKRALLSRQVKIESLEQLYSMISTVSLQPQPVPLDVKVVLLGDRLLYYLLSAYDPDFLDLFKVQADFEEDLDRDEESQQLYARMIATMARREGVRPLEKTGVARVIEHGSRIVDDSERLTTHNRQIADLLSEANFWAGDAGSHVIDETHIQRAIDHQEYRASRIRERMDRAIQRETILIDTEGEATAQINGLSVMQLGNYAFGRPTRITATARLGRGHMVDIEREAKLGGSIHSKGVMILSNLLGARYAQDHPLSLNASIAFEQSYGMVDGDSASVAEFCVLLSALSDLPIRQSLACTGSLNQHGKVQAVGGVNEKIEGFFDVCSARGLTGEQGVLLPASNVPHLMLRPDVREAVAAGRFHIYPLNTVDEALEMLTGREAGERGDEGQFPEGSVNRLVDDRLQELSRLQRWESRPERGSNGKSETDNGNDE